MGRLIFFFVFLFCFFGPFHLRELNVAVPSVSREPRNQSVKPIASMGDLTKRRPTERRRKCRAKEAFEPGRQEPVSERQFMDEGTEKKVPTVHWGGQ